MRTYQRVFYIHIVVFFGSDIPHKEEKLNLLLETK